VTSGELLLEKHISWLTFSAAGSELAAVSFQQVFLLSFLTCSLRLIRFAYPSGYLRQSISLRSVVSPTAGCGYLSHARVRSGIFVTFVRFC
jgi:hypothetical protein